MAKSKTQLEAAKRRAETQKQQQRQQMQSLVIVAGTAIFAFVVFIVLINSTGNTPVAKGKYGQFAQNQTSDGLPIIGDPSSKVIVAEFSDFGCPYCLQYKSVISSLIETQVKAGNLRLLFVPQLFHQNSDQATRAALCAQKQGKFWEMHDELFDVQSTQGLAGFELSKLRARAVAIGLDTTAWLNCAASTEVDQVMTNARKLFDRVGGKGTPTMMWSTDEGQTWALFTNASGQVYDSGGVPEDIVVKTIEDYYNRAKT